MNKKVIALLMVTSLMAGCADAIPDAPFGGEEEVVVEWTTLNGEYTIVWGPHETGEENMTEIDWDSSTYSIVTIGSDNTWLEVNSFNYTATHLSFEIVNNTVLFNNYTFENDGFLTQMEVGMFSVGYAPNMGTAQLYFPEFPYDITVNYTVSYRTENGR